MTLRSDPDKSRTCQSQGVLIVRRFGELTAVEDVTMSVASDQFFGFLGPNGTGKSTTIKMLTRLLEPEFSCCFFRLLPFARFGWLRTSSIACSSCWLHVPAVALGSPIGRSPGSQANTLTALLIQPVMPVVGAAGPSKHLKKLEPEKRGAEVAGTRSPLMNSKTGSLVVGISGAARSNSKPRKHNNALMRFVNRSTTQQGR